MRPLSIALVAALAACDTLGVDAPLEPEPSVQAWDAMLDAVNDARARGAVCGGERMGPVGPLIWDGRLEAAAGHHSRDMARHGYFDHTGSDGLGTGDRVRRAGYDWRAVGENIAQRQTSVAQVIGDWMGSPGHCRQIMSPRFQEMGAAEVDGYWTQVFGVPR